MKYLIQENIYGERHHETLLHNLERMGLEYELFKVIPFVNKIEFKSRPEGKVFVFGAVKAAHIAAEYGFVPGSMYNRNHDAEVYGPLYGDRMLNSDAYIMNFDSPLPADDKWTMFFARPCGDTKLFSGQVYMRYSWDEYVAEMLCEDKVLYEGEAIEDVRRRIQGYRDSKVIIAPLKEIAYEVRCWIVGGKVVTMSEYKRGRRVVYKNVDHYGQLREKVQSYVDIYQPAEAFVMDVCVLVGDGGSVENLKIVEINCLNCAGFYDANMQMLLNALEEHFDDNEYNVFNYDRI